MMIQSDRGFVTSTPSQKKEVEEYMSNNNVTENEEYISDEVTLKVEMKDTQKIPVKIEIVKRESFVDETKHVFMVQVYDNEGELIDETGFKSENLAGRYAFEMEQYYKFLKED